MPIPSRKQELLEYRQALIQFERILQQREKELYLITNSFELTYLLQHFHNMIQATTSQRQKVDGLVQQFAVE